MSAPQVVPASFFRRSSFLTDLAATASRCVFHVRRVSSVTLRKVRLSTCGTDMSSRFGTTFSFTVESEKNVCLCFAAVDFHAPSVCPGAHSVDGLLHDMCGCGGVFSRGACSQVISMWGICDCKWEGIDNVIYVQKK